MSLLGQNGLQNPKNRDFCRFWGSCGPPTPDPPIGGSRGGWGGQNSQNRPLKIDRFFVAHLFARRFLDPPPRLKQTQRGSEFWSKNDTFGQKVCHTTFLGGYPPLGTPRPPHGGQKVETRGVATQKPPKRTIILCFACLFEKIIIFVAKRQKKVEKVTVFQNFTDF